MTDPTGPVVGEDVSSPFPSGYGPVGGAPAASGNGDGALGGRRRRRAGTEADPGPAPAISARRSTRRTTSPPKPAAPTPTRTPAAPSLAPTASPAPSDGWAPIGAVPAASPEPVAVTVVGSEGVPVRRLVRKIDAWTVFKVSLIFYLLFLVMVLVGGVVAWKVAVNLGFIADIQKAVRSLADDRKFVLHPMPVLEWSAAAGGVLAVVGTVINTVAAVLYNFISDLVGGIQTVEVAQGE